MCSQVLGLTGSPGGDNSLVQLLLLRLHLLVICVCHDCLSARTISNAGPLHGHLRHLLWMHATIGVCNCVHELFLTAASEIIESLGMGCILINVLDTVDKVMLLRLQLYKCSLTRSALCFATKRTWTFGNVQMTTLNKQQRLCQNMRAVFLVVPFDSDEVRQIAPPPEEVLLWVDPRHEDKTFALDLAAVLLQHMEILAIALPGGLTFSHSYCQLALVNLAALLDHEAIVTLASRVWLSCNQNLNC